MDISRPLDRLIEIDKWRLGLNTVNRFQLNACMVHRFEWKMLAIHIHVYTFLIEKKRINQTRLWWKLYKVTITLNMMMKMI